MLRRAKKNPGRDLRGQGDSVTAFLMIAFGVLLSIRESRSLWIKKPAQSLSHIWQSMGEFFLALSFMTIFFTAPTIFSQTPWLVQKDSLVLIGVLSYAFSNLYKKGDVFFLVLTLAVFLVLLQQDDLSGRLLLCLKLYLGIGFFQTCFLGLRHRLLFSNLPVSMQGWPVLCLLASFISLVMWKVAQ